MLLTRWRLSVVDRSCSPAADDDDPIPPCLHAVQDGLQPRGAASTTYRGAVDAARVMWRKEGARAFYRGLSPAWLGSGREATGMAGIGREATGMHDRSR